MLMNFDEVNIPSEKSKKHTEKPALFKQYKQSTPSVDDFRSCRRHVPRGPRLFSDVTGFLLILFGFRLFDLGLFGLRWVLGAGWLVALVASISSKDMR